MPDSYLKRCAQPILDCVSLSLPNCSTVCLLDHQVSGSCSNVVADTDWASCLKGDSCPLGFIKTDDDLECGPQKVCCLMRPTFDVNVSTRNSS